MKDTEILKDEELIYKLQAPGSLYIDSIPAGELIYIDNVLQTTTPATITGLSAGSHTYKLTLSGYQDVTGSFSIAAGQAANMLVINRDSLTLDGTQTYNYINIANGGKLYVTAYNGTGTTGTLILNVTDINVDSASSIIGTARGYRGGVGGLSPGCTGNNCAGKGGELAGYGGGSNGSSCTFPCSNVGGGGGGGGYGTIGGKGGGVVVTNYYDVGGTGGVVNGTLNGYDIDMGSGGGGGGTFGGMSGSPAGSSGSPGGGMLTINAYNINIHGIVNFNGGNGGDGGSYGGACCTDGGGGGASGGGILFSATNVNITGATITANGGNGGANGGLVYGQYGYAGPGGGGRIKMFYSGTLINTGATISAGTVFMPTPPNITATNMTITPSETPCMIETCTVTVGVTWANQGGSSGTFTPNISIDGVPSSSPLPAEPLDVGVSTTHSFSVTGLSAGSHSICPYPN